MESLDEIDTKDVKNINTIINLNVGGKLFDASWSTLSLAPKDSFLGSLLRITNSKTSMSTTLDKDGRIFIDRDGKHFRHILNYLREAGLWTPASTCLTFGHLQELLLEVKFYGLERMAELLTLKLSELTMNAKTEKETKETVTSVLLISPSFININFLKQFLHFGFHFEISDWDRNLFVLSGPAWNSKLSLHALDERDVTVTVRPVPDLSSVIIPPESKKQYSFGVFSRKHY